MSARQGRPAIGVVAGWQVYERTTPNWFLEAVLRGIAEAGAALGCDVLLSCGVGPQIDDPREVRPAWPVPGEEVDFVPVGPWNTDGLIFVSPLRTAARRGFAQQIREAGFPVAFVGSGDGTPAVVADSAAGFREALEHLRSHGHRAVAFVSGDPLDGGDSFHRLATFRLLRVELGLDESEDLVAPGLHTEEGGYHAMRAILAVGHPFTAVLASNDTSAVGALRALAESGRRVPEDVAVVGFDDQPGACANVPPLATVSFPVAEAGRRAVEVVLSLVERRSPAAETISVPTRLMRRRSCGCLRGEADVTEALPGRAPAAEGRGTAETMVLALERARAHLPPATVVELCRRLESGLTRSVREGSSAPFEAALMGLLQRVEAGGGRAQHWHPALTALRAAVVPRLEPADRAAAEDLLHLARVALSESADRLEARCRAADARQVDDVSALTVSLQSAQSEREILELLVRHSPSLGLAPACVAVYEPEEADPVAWSRLILDAGVIAGDPTVRRVPTRALGRDSLSARPGPRCLVVLPLAVSGRPIGFLALDAATLAPGAAVARQVAMALEGVRLQAAVRTLTFTDDLTGLHNRRFFDQVLLREAERARRFGRNLALVLLDVDHFKAYNDTFGHPAGDEALRRVARHLTAAVPRRLDSLARYGGEEFAVLLAETNLEGARLVAERIRERVRASADFLRPLTISAGVAVAAAGAVDPTTLVHRADEALYQAKRDGRDCVRLAADLSAPAGS